MAGRDIFHEMAKRYVRRWLRAARYAAQTSSVDALLRYRLRGGLNEVIRARRDLENEDFERLYRRARVTAVWRMRETINAELAELVHTYPTWKAPHLLRELECRGLPISEAVVYRWLRRFRSTEPVT